MWASEWVTEEAFLVHSSAYPYILHHGHAAWSMDYAMNFWSHRKCGIVIRRKWFRMVNSQHEFWFELQASFAKKLASTMFGYSKQLVVEPSTKSMHSRKHRVCILQKFAHMEHPKLRAD